MGNNGKIFIRLLRDKKYRFILSLIVYFVNRGSGRLGAGLYSVTVTHEDLTFIL